MPRWSSPRWSTGWIALLLLACKPAPAAPEPALTQEEKQIPSVDVAVDPARSVSSSGVDPRLPVVGDPLGLLSKPPAPSAKTGGRAQGAKLDPAALMASPGARPNSAPSPEATPARQRSGDVERPALRARGPVQVKEKSAHEVVRRASQGGARAHVLFLYASYCKACRGVMPTFMQLVRTYKGRGVAFTAASVDHDPDAFASYAGVLEGALDAFWIRSDGTTRAELKSAGIKLPNDVFSIPLFAVFAGQRRPVAQGNSRELSQLPATLDELL